MNQQTRRQANDCNQSLASTKTSTSSVKMISSYTELFLYDGYFFILAACLLGSPTMSMLNYYDFQKANEKGTACADVQLYNLLQLKKLSIFN